MTNTIPQIALNNGVQMPVLGYLDLYLIHQPLGDYYSSWRALQELVETHRFFSAAPNRT